MASRAARTRNVIAKADTRVGTPPCSSLPMDSGTFSVKAHPMTTNAASMVTASSQSWATPRQRSRLLRPVTVRPSSTRGMSSAETTKKRPAMPTPGSPAFTGQWPFS
jgi:hypothetical protein